MGWAQSAVSLELSLRVEFPAQSFSLFQSLTTNNERMEARILFLGGRVWRIDQQPLVIFWQGFYRKYIARCRVCKSYEHLCRLALYDTSSKYPTQGAGSTTDLSSGPIYLSLLRFLEWLGNMLISTSTSAPLSTVATGENSPNTSHCLLSCSGIVSISLS